ncbi:dienelactone hydrolase [Bradyrhizobium sp. F1.4.3]|uniref:alpha/beta hydrolase n=1 Tax=Bradyrhizobium sp. F1.4.3 TaxID=3156356 RepID=UPI0033923BFA
MTTPSRRHASQPFVDKIYEVDVTGDVIYGFGGVDYTAEQGPSRYRALKLDVYEPRDGQTAPRPALILAFGGAFHRGSKGAEVFEGENPSTAMAEYCREFARRGYVCFSIDYRLMQEAPDPGVTPFLLPNQPQNRDRIDFVRNILGLPPSTPEMMNDTLEAATDDMTMAVNFVRSQSGRFGVDVARIAVGGFSAGAAIALNSAFAEHAPAAAVIALSGRIAGATMQAHLKPYSRLPAALVSYGDNDLPVILGGIDEMRAHFDKVGVDNLFVRVPDANHFYLRSAVAAGANGHAAALEDLIADFLYDQLALATLTRAAA